MTKCVMPITTAKGYDHHIHAAQLKQVASHLIETANWLYDIGNERSSTELMSIVEDMIAEAEFIEKRPRVIYQV